MNENSKTRKELRADIREEVKADKLAAEGKKSREERKQRKQAIKGMPKEERKAAKKHDKIYNRIWNQTRRRIIQSVVLVLVAWLIIYIFPIGRDMGRLLKADFINLTTETPEAREAQENGNLIAAEIPEEGIVLLKNEDNILPLSNKKINVFGESSMNILYGGIGSGSADYSNAVSLTQGLDNAGIEYNQELTELYGGDEDEVENKSGAAQILTRTENDEPPIEHLTDEILERAKQFSDTALIVLSSTASEAADFAPENLRLTKNRADLVERIANHFDNVIIVINSGNVMEIGFLEEYDSIKGAIWMGYPGAYGCNALGNILAGDLNPSGRLVDTHVYDVESPPSAVGFGDNPYTNYKEAFINYYEGIYVGYRFYETYYLGDEAAYQQAVQYPFGYGLSYTDFDWQIVGDSYNPDRIELEIKVENIGDMAGKDVVQVYFTPPYTPGGIEKSAMELAGFAKTKTLQPGESETVTITVNMRDMASYDVYTEQAFVLEAGKYDIKLARNVHDVVEVLDCELAETIVYKTDDATGVEIENRFEDAAGDLTYLSRNDWEGTFPNASDINYEASESVLEGVKIKFEKTEGEIPTTGEDHGIVLSDLKGLEYDDPMWDKFLDQFTLKEMKKLVIDGAYKTVAIDRLGIPATTLLDGPAGISFFFGSYSTASYPTEVLLASTWNLDLAERMGDAVGREAKAYGLDGWYAPGMNIHRTAMGGRNFEYFSEDPFLSGAMSVAITQGAQSHDIMVFMKHFAINDQETNARSGLLTWLNEQALREIYLKPFEMSVKEGDVIAVMSSFPRIGSTWSGGNEALLEEVLRQEWGFRGMVSSDATMRFWPFMDLYEGVKAGTDLYLDILPTMNTRYFNKNYKKDPVGFSQGMRERVHNICYAIARTSAVK